MIETSILDSRRELISNILQPENDNYLEQSSITDEMSDVEEANSNI
jgi:hypothetical protein